MSSRTNTRSALISCRAIMLLLVFGGAASAQTDNASKSAKQLTVERIYSGPNLSGHTLRGLAWTPDGKQISFLDATRSGAESAGQDSSENERSGKQKKENSPALWIVDAASGDRRVLISGDRLASMLPENFSAPSQATGLGRHAPADYQWAPDGAALLFQGPNALVWFELKSKTPRTLVSGKATLADPKISPDGKFLSFIRDHNLWLVNIADGKERAITRDGMEEIRKGELDWVYPEELDIKTAYWWAPDSSAVAYLEMDERKVAQYPLVDFASFEGKAEMERYPPAGGANPVVHVFVMSLSGGQAKEMDTGPETDQYIPRVNWLPDSKHVAIERLNRAQTILDLIVADAATGASRVALTEKDQYWINVSDDLRFLQDGQRFLWSSERSGFRHIYLYNLKGQQLAQLTKGDWEVSAVDAVDEKAGLIYFTATEKSPMERHLYRVGLDGSGFTRITKEAGTHAVNFSPSVGSPPGVNVTSSANTSVSAFIDTYSNTMNPPRQDLLRLDGSRIAVLSENKVAELASYQLSPVEFLQVKSHDGVMLNAYMIKPANFDPHRKYPVLVHTYGGPHVQIVTNEWGRSTFLWHQLMAQKGYIIFALDNRGSAGRGHLFEEPIHYRLGAQELSDQRDGAAYLKSLSYVDANRMGIWGWSYGGHMTLHAMFEDWSDFKAGFAGGPVTDWHYYDSIYTERYVGLLPQNEEYYKASSPIDKVKQFRGKLLIAHGTGDDNVHFANTLELINELIENEKYVEVLPFPGRGHGISDAPAQRLLMERVTRFFLDNL
ncbi:MAG TPA: S9 family peptidase [Candidatus Acidoferrum sp.]|nr:S9 family peptidase [Candidatus Acidoferrum sp.]